VEVAGDNIVVVEVHMVVAIADRTTAAKCFLIG
jgi:hypothetical protein